MGMSVQFHPDRFETVSFTDKLDPFVVVRAYEGEASASLFLRTAADCDALIAAAVEAKRLLDPPAPEPEPWHCMHCGTDYTVPRTQAPICPKCKPGLVITDDGFEIEDRRPDHDGPIGSSRCIRAAGHDAAHFNADGTNWGTTAELAAMREQPYPQATS